MHRMAKYAAEQRLKLSHWDNSNTDYNAELHHCRMLLLAVPEGRPLYGKVGPTTGARCGGDRGIRLPEPLQEVHRWMAGNTMACTLPGGLGLATSLVRRDRAGPME